MSPTLAKVNGFKQINDDHIFLWRKSNNSNKVKERFR